MSVRTTHRLAVMAGPMVAAVLVLGACGGDGTSGATKETVELAAGDTDYQTIAPATTSTTVAGDSTAATGPETEYTIKAGDFPLGLADKLGVSLDELASLNGWANCSVSGCATFPAPNTVIKVPGTATVPAATPDAGATGDTAPPDATGDTTPAETGEAIPDPGSNCEAGSHTVVSGDIPLKLVDLYDVTLEALNQANADNPAYQTFIPGQKIIIPPKSDC